MHLIDFSGVIFITTSEKAISSVSGYCVRRSKLSKNQIHQATHIPHSELPERKIVKHLKADEFSPF